MKKLMVFVLLAANSNICRGMETGCSLPNPKIIVTFRDGTAEFDQLTFKLLHKYSPVIKNIFESTIPSALTLTGATRKTIEELIDHLSFIETSNNIFKVIELIKKISLANLTSLLSAADYLGIEPLIQAYNRELKQRLSDPAFLKKFKENPEIINALNLDPEINEMVTRDLLSQLSDQLKTQLTIAPKLINQFTLDFYPLSTEMSQNGKLLILSYSDKENPDKQKIRVLNINTQTSFDIPTEESTFIPHHAAWTGLTSTISANSSLLALGQPNHNNVKLWDLEQQKEIHVFNTPVQAIAFAPNNQLLAIGASNTISVFDLSSFSSVQTIKIKSNSIPTMLFTQDSSQLIVGNSGYEDMITIWDISGKELTAELNPEMSGGTSKFFGMTSSSFRTKGNSYSLALNKQGDILAAGTSSGLVVFNIISRKQLAAYPQHFTDAVSFIDDGNFLLGQHFNTISIFNMKSSSERHTA